MQNEDPTTTETPPATSKGAITRIVAELTEFRGILAKLIDQLGETAKQVRTLQAIVRVALPSNLLRLTPDHVAMLREKAPNTKVRLIAPFRSGLINYPEGTVLRVREPNVKTYGTAMQLALHLGVDSDVSSIVQELVDAEVREQARLESEETRRALQAQAEAHGHSAERLKAQADALRS